MRIVFINLDRSPERRAHMEAQLAAFGLPAERVRAVDGRLDDISAVPATGLTSGEIGCFLSHRQCWQRLVASGEPAMLVLEDDVRLSQRLPSVLSGLNAALNNADIVKLDTSGRVVALKPAGGAAEGTSLHRLCGEHTGTAGYLITRTGAEKLLARMKAGMDKPVDLFMFGENAVRDSSIIILQAVPALVVQEKRLGTAAQAGMASAIGKRKARRGSVATLMSRELRRGTRKLLRSLARLPSRITGKRRFIRITFD